MQGEISPNMNTSSLLDGCLLPLKADSHIKVLAFFEAGTISEDVNPSKEITSVDIPLGSVCLL